MLLKQRWLRRACIWGLLALLVVVLGHQGAIAQTTSEDSTQDIIQVSTVLLQLVYVLIGFFAGSLLVVENRRWGPFFLGLLVLTIIFNAITNFGVDFKDIQLSNATALFVTVVIGLALGIFVIGVWWWGQRQGYMHGLYVALFRADKCDQDFRTLVFENEKDQVFRALALNDDDQIFRALVLQDEDDQTKLGIWKKLCFWKTPGFRKFLYSRRNLYYRAATVRYRRLMQRPEINNLYNLLAKDVLLEAKQREEERLAKEKTQKLEALLEEVEGEYKQTLETLSPRVLPRE